jgi:hypothetical protein
MIFSKNKKDKVRDPFTIEECQSCKKESKRRFKEGDYLFKDSSGCNSCNGKMMIVKIFGEVIKEK